MAARNQPEQWDIVLIIWEDAFSDNRGGCDSRTYLRTYRPCVRQTVGFYIGEDDRRIMLAGTRDSLVSTDQDCDDVFIIPKGLTLKPIRILKRNEQDA